MSTKTVTALPLLQKTKHGLLDILGLWFNRQDLEDSQADAIVMSWQKFELERMEKTLSGSDQDLQTEKSDFPEKTGAKEKENQGGKGAGVGVGVGAGAGVANKGGAEAMKKDVVSEFGQRSTIHGLNKVMERSSFIGRR